MKFRLADLCWFFTLTAVSLWAVSLQIRLNRSMELVEAKRSGTLVKITFAGGDTFWFSYFELQKYYPTTYEKVLAVEVEPADDGLKSVLKKSAP